jgi:hypothetical protein
LSLLYENLLLSPTERARKLEGANSLQALRVAEQGQRLRAIKDLHAIKELECLQEAIDKAGL